MTADDGDGPACENEARSGNDAHLDCFAQQECGAVLRAAVPHRGYAGIEVTSGVLRCLHGEHFVGQGRKLVARASVADAVQVDMAVNEAGQDCGVAVVDLLNGRAFGGMHRLCRADLPNGVAFEKDCRLLLHGFRCGVNETGGFQEGELGVVCWHIWSPNGCCRVCGFLLSQE